jgi:glycosyltransferase involved in cell wall biosynthesis
MALGLPIVGLATTEMATAVRNGVNGYVETDPDRLVGHLKRLLADHDEAAELSAGARKVAQERFGIDRFAAQWLEVLQAAAGGR